MAQTARSEKLGVLVGGTRYGDPTTLEVRFCFDILDLDSGAAEPSRIPLDFLAHGFAPHPIRRREAALLEKRGPGGAYVDLADRVALRPIVPLPNHHFYGHGAFTASGDALLAVETSLTSNDGVISVRDPDRFEVIDRFPTYGMAPHDCTLIDDGKTLAITNGGGRFGTDALANVAFVDVATRKLLDKHEVSDPNVNAGHIALGKNREITLVSAPRDGLAEDALGGVSLRLRGGALKRAAEPSQVMSRMKGESLSICIHDETRTAVATHPYGNFISFWNLDTGALFAAFDVPNPRGVTLTLDRKRFALSFGPAGNLMFIDTRPLKPIPDANPTARRFGGSHIYTWSL